MLLTTVSHSFAKQEGPPGSTIYVPITFVAVKLISYFGKSSPNDYSC